MSGRPTEPSVNKNVCFRKLMDGLRCIDNFTTKCLEAEHRAYFNTLYTGTTQVIVDLCQKGEYQTGEQDYSWLQNNRIFYGNISEYLQHAPCMRKAQTEYESCADEYQLRIKTLNKVGVSCVGNNKTIMPVFDRVPLRHKIYSKMSWDNFTPSPLPYIEN